MKSLFGEALRNLRRKTGKSQIEVANEITKMFNLNMSQASLSTLEQRETLPKHQLIETFATYYNVPLSYFIEANEDLVGTDLAVDYIRALRDGKLNSNGKKVFARSEGRRSENDDISRSLSNLAQNIDEEDIF